jgi:hypothetical protein
MCEGNIFVSSSRASTIRPSPYDHRERLWDSQAKIAIRPSAIFSKKNWEVLFAKKIVRRAVPLAFGEGP